LVTIIRGAPVSILGGQEWAATALEIVLKHVFLNNTSTFCAIGLLDESFSKKLHVKKKKLQYKIPATNLKYRTT